MGYQAPFVFSRVSRRISLQLQNDGGGNTLRPFSDLVNNFERAVGIQGLKLFVNATNPHRHVFGLEGCTQSGFVDLLP